MVTKRSVITCSVCGQQGHRKESHERPETKFRHECQQILPMSLFRIRSYRGKPAHLGDYREPTCRECSNNISRRYYRSSFPVRFTYLLVSARTHSRKIGRECTIDIPYIQSVFDKQQGLCYYTGWELSLETGDYAISMDRSDPSQGYISGNIVLTCWLINNMKRHLNERQFIEICGRIFKTRHVEIPDQEK